MVLISTTWEADLHCGQEQIMSGQFNMGENSGIQLQHLKDIKNTL